MRAAAIQGFAIQGFAIQGFCAGPMNWCIILFFAKNAMGC